jgi:hypothetical protein
VSDAVAEFDAVKRPDGTVRVRMLVTLPDGSLLALYFDAAQARGLADDLDRAILGTAGHRPVIDGHSRGRAAETDDD